MFEYFSATEKWKKITFMVAIYLFLSQLLPLEPFLTAYLTGPDVNVSISEVSNVIQSIKVYTAFLSSIIMFFTADYLRYKPNLLVLTAWSCLSNYLLTGSPSVMRLRLSTVGIGAMYTSIMLAFSYLYAQIEDVKQFQMATGVVTAAMQLGTFVGDVSAQIIVYATGGRYTILPYCSALTLFMALLWLILFPSIKRKNDFPVTSVSNENTLLLKHDNKDLSKKLNFLKTRINEIRVNFITSYSNPIVLKRSLWYILGMAAYIQVLANINILYSYVVKEPGNHDVLSNGFAEATVTFCGAAGAYLIGKVNLDWTSYGDVFTAVCSIIMGVLIISFYFYDHLTLIYSSYVLFGLVCQAHFVINYAEIAKRLNNQCYSLVLEFNMVGAYITVSIMTLFLTEVNFMHITIPGRFLFIGGIFLKLGIVFLFNVIFPRGKHKTFQ